MDTDLHALLSRLPGCAHLDESARAALAAGSRAEQWPAGARILTEGDPAPDWYRDRRVGRDPGVRPGPEGEAHADYLGPGDVLDPGAPGRPAAYSITAVEATRARLVPQSLVARHRGALALEPTSGYRGEMSLFLRHVSDLIKGAAGDLRAGRHGGRGGPVDDPTADRIGDRPRRGRRPGRASSPTVTSGLEWWRPGCRRARWSAQVMSSPVIGISPGALAFDALLEMTRRGIHHLAVTAREGLLGVVSSHDLVLLQGAQPVGLAREIEAAGSEEGLAALASRVPSVVQVAGGRRRRRGGDRPPRRRAERPARAARAGSGAVGHRGGGRRPASGAVHVARGRERGPA